MIMPTLNTLFNQTFQDFEIIVVDDNSSDNTFELLQPLIESKRIKYFKHETNLERAVARNTGLDNAVGEYVTFLDSDDFMYPTCIEEASKFTAREPDTKMFHCLSEWVNDNQKRVGSFKYPKVSKVRQEILKGNFLACIGVFLKKEVYSVERFDIHPELVGSEDHDYWIRLFGKYRYMGRIDKVLCAMQQHSNRTMNQHGLEQAIRRKKYMYKKYLDDQGFNNSYPGKIMIFKAYCLTFIASASLGVKSRIGIWKYLFAAITSDFRIVLNEFFIKVFILSIIKSKD